MRGITKGTEPPSLTAHRQVNFSSYDNYLDKDLLRQSLVSEQRGICCYCMGRILNNTARMKVEHWHCQDTYPKEQLIYKNLLGACMGGEGQPPWHQHCDTKKGKLTLKWNPANPDHNIEARISYWADGSIHSPDRDFDRELVDVLNLNHAILKSNRYEVLNIVVDWWKANAKRKAGEKLIIQQKRTRIIAGTGDLETYCQVAVWWLDQRIASL